MTTVLHRLFLAATFIGFALPRALCQQPSATPSEIKIQNVTFEGAALPGTNRQWIRVVTQFQCAPRWADGVVFSYSVLIGTGDQFRVLPGIVRYANVKGGANRAVMYISPNTAERFGAPLAAHVKAFYKDEVADDFTSKPSGNVSAAWETQYNKYDGLLLTVVHTPLVFSDYNASPDLLETH